MAFVLNAFTGVRKYGKDFKAIAEVIGNKTETHVRSFFVNFRRRYNLDEVLGEYEAEHGKTDWDKSDTKEEEDDVKEAEVSRTKIFFRFFISKLLCIFYALKHKCLTLTILNPFFPTYFIDRAWFDLEDFQVYTLARVAFIQLSA